MLNTVHFSNGEYIASAYTQAIIKTAFTSSYFDSLLLFSLSSKMLNAYCGWVPFLFILKNYFYFAFRQMRKTHLLEYIFFLRVTCLEEALGPPEYN